MTINLNINSNLQNYYVNNINTDTDGGGSVMPSHEAEANGYTYGDAVEISLSANAQSYNAEQVPNGERPPVGETVVVWGPVRETSAGGTSSFSGWAETDGGASGGYDQWSVTDTFQEDAIQNQTQLIDNKPKRAHNERWTDSATGRVYQHYKKSEALAEVDALGRIIAGGAGLGTIGVAIAERLNISAVLRYVPGAKQITGITVVALAIYGAIIQLGPDEGDLLIDDPFNPYNQYRPIENDGSEEGNWGPNYNQTNSWDM